MTSNLYRMLAGASFLMATVPLMASAQQATTVSGRVTSEAAAPVPGASVSIPALGVGSYTSNDGRFTFTVPANRVTGQNVSLVARRIGYTPVTAAITLSGSSVTHDFRLATATTQLEGVVVTALGLEREKRSLGIAAQSVAGADLNQTRQPNIVTALSGKVAGVKVTTSTNFGGSARIVIRGENSIGGNNQPIWVVDGVAVDNSNFTTLNQQRGVGGIDFGNAIQDLNSEDIESISVLKGPAAAALYGSRAAAGAIIVTTKSGRGAPRGFQATASSNITFDQVSKLPEYQNQYGQGYLGQFEFVNGVGDGLFDGVDESWGPKLDGRLIPQWYSRGEAVPWVPAPDNVSSFFQDGLSVSNNLSATGSGERANFRLSFGNDQSKGIVPGSRLNRLTAGLNGTASLSEKLQATASVQYIKNKGYNRPGTGYDELNPLMGFTWFGRNVDVGMLKAFMTDSALQVYNAANGVDYTNMVNWNYNYHSNPWWNVEMNSNFDDRNRMIGSAQLQYKPYSWLTGMIRTGTDFYNQNRGFNFAPGWIGGYGGDPNTLGDYSQGGFANTTDLVNENNTDFLLTAVSTPLERLGLTINFGGNRRVRTLQQRWIGTDKLSGPGIYNMSNAAILYTPTQYDERRQINSLYGTTQFAFNDYFFVDVTGRNDWSSTLPAGKNSYFYPSVSSSLVFTDLFPAAKVAGLSYGKLRAAWTRVGSDANPYLLRLAYDNGDSYFGNARFAVPNTLTNPELKPEQTQAWEIGTELSFLDGRAGLDLTYYQKRTTDQILTASVASSTGFTRAAVNAGALSNKGIEVQLTGSPIKASTADGFSWDVTANYAQNKNRLEALYGTSDTYQIGNPFFNVTIEARLGQPYGSIVGRDFRRDSLGRMVLSSSSGTPLPALKTSILGNIQPTWTGGFINTFRYKNFDLSGQIDARIGGQLYSATTSWGRYAGILKETLEGREDSVTVSGVLANGTEVTRKVSAQNYWHGIGYNSGDVSNVVDASWVKLRELRLGWAVPQALLGNLTGYRMNVALVGRNLWLHANAPHIDPETAFSAGNLQGLEMGQLPSTRSLGFQVSVTP
ncbi:MAG: SusC/RagA family TonB-linked outer membrane protein [Gemmatimonadetes bacterium]|nr:MAG: SusC/RagA family TonB-linked outer membrane protein [Gemmatimonadota bacterium]